MAQIPSLARELPYAVGMAIALKSCNMDGNVKNRERSHPVSQDVMILMARVFPHVSKSFISDSDKKTKILNVTKKPRQ